MKTRYTIELSSPHAIGLMTRHAPWLKNRTMVTAALHKLAHLNQLARQHYVYACPLLVACHETIEHVQSALLTQMAKYQECFCQRGIPADKFTAATHYQKTVSIYHRLSLDVLRTIEYYDTAVCLIMGARQAKIFVDRHTAFQVIYQYQKMVFTLLTTLWQSHVSDIPHVTIQDYINNTSSYQKAAFQFGAINAKHVLTAIKADLLPQLSHRQANTYQHHLQRFLKD